VSMGLLTTSQEMRFVEGVLQAFSSNTTFDYTDTQGVTKRAHGTVSVYVDDTCVVRFGTRQEHEILLLRVLKRMDVHNLKMQTAKCDFLRHEASDVRSVCVFVSLCSYYRKYIWRFAEITAPLMKLNEF
jgi:hypothetical protein